MYTATEIYHITNNYLLLFLSILPGGFIYIIMHFIFNINLTPISSIKIENFINEMGSVNSISLNLDDMVSGSLHPLSYRCNFPSDILYNHQTPSNLLNFDVRDILHKLNEIDKADEDAARNAIFNFDKLPIDIRNFLFELSENNRNTETVARYVVSNFDKLPPDVRNKLLLELSKRIKLLRLLQEYKVNGR